MRSSVLVAVDAMFNRRLSSVWTRKFVNEVSSTCVVMSSKLLDKLMVEIRRSSENIITSKPVMSFTERWGAGKKSGQREFRLRGAGGHIHSHTHPRRNKRRWDRNKYGTWDEWFFFLQTLQRSDFFFNFCFCLPS